MDKTEKDRPEGWENSWDNEREFDGMASDAEIFEAGADALIEAGYRLPSTEKDNSLGEKIGKDTYNKLYSIMEGGSVPTWHELDLFIKGLGYQPSKDYNFSPIREADSVKPSTREAARDVLNDYSNSQDNLIHGNCTEWLRIEDAIDQIFALIQPKVLSDEEFTSEEAGELLVCFVNEYVRNYGKYSKRARNSNIYKKLKAISQATIKREE